MASSNHDMNLIIKAKDTASATINKTLDNWKNAVLGVGAAYLGFSMIKNVIEGIISVGMEAEKTWNAVAASLKRHNYQVQINIESIKEFSSRMQQQTGISDELIGRGIQRLLDANMKLADTYEVIQAAADLSKAKDMDLMAATELLAKASMGVTDTLTRYGIVIDNNIPKAERFALVLEQINERFGGAAQADLETTAGKLKLIKENLSDLGEEFYQVMVGQNEIVRGSSDFINATLERLTRGLKIYREEGFRAMIRAEDEERESLRRWEKWTREIAEIRKRPLISEREDSLRLAEMKRKLEESEKIMNRILQGTEKITVSFPVGPMSDAIDSMLELNKAIKDTTLSEEKEYINELADKWISANEIYATVAKDRVNVHLDMIEQIEAVDESYFEAISEMRARDLFDSVHERLQAVEKINSEQIRREQQAMNILARTADAGIRHIIGSMKILQTESSSVFTTMAQEFTKLFIEESLRQLSLKFIGSLSGGGFLGLLSSIFDTRANDAMAMKQGSDFAKYFSMGALKELNSFAPQITYNAAPIAAASGAVNSNQTIIYQNFYGVVADDFIQRDVIPSVSIASKRRETSLYAVEDRRFGGSRVYSN